jgi:hypothetical protein
LFGAGLQLSGVQNADIARLLLIFAAISGGIAVITWPPIWDRLPHFGVRQAIRDRLPFVVTSPIVWKERIPLDEAAFGLVDFEHAAVKAMARMSRLLAGLANDQQRITRIVRAYTPRFEKSVDWPADRKRRLARSMASQLSPLAGSMERRERELRTETEAMSRNYLSRIKAGPYPTDGPQIRAVLVNMRDAASESRAQMANYRSTVVQTRSLNFQQSINEVMDRLISVATDIVSDFDMSIRFATAGIRQLDDKAPRTMPARRGRGRAGGRKAA